METRRLGSLTVSAIGLGCGNFAARMDYDASAAVIRKALDLGITFFDTADSYGAGGSEEFLGRTLPARDEVLIATKFGKRVGATPAGADAAYIRSACESSLRRLRTDHIDLYQLHTPHPQTPIAETLDALDRLKAEGKIREFGCSNFSAEQIAQSGGRFVSAQEEYSLLVRDAELDKIPALKKSGMSLLPYFPLANGLLTGKYAAGIADHYRLAKMQTLAERYLTETRLSRVAELAAEAQARGLTLLEWAITWLLEQPIVASVVCGASNPGQIEQNARAGLRQ